MPPGIARFVAVDLKLAGGSTPSAAGLDWLVEKGYRTVLDLRESSEVSSAFIAEATNRGLRYVALPIGLKSLDRNHIDRFGDELAAAAARPLFFFDRDGTRAGAMWYIRRIVHDRVSEGIAQREAEDLGLTDASYWTAAKRYSAAAVSIPSRAAASASAPFSPQGPAAPEKPAPKPAAVPPQSSPAQAVSDRPRSPEPARGEPTSPAPQQASAQPTFPADGDAWRPFAAVVVTGLTLPLAYWTSSLIPGALAKARASLPAPAHRRQALPRELGA